MLSERLLQVEERIQNAVNRAGRKRDEITLSRGDKKIPGGGHARSLRARPARVSARIMCRSSSANTRRSPTLVGAEFHLIGHLQSNKSRIAGDLFQVIETVDSEKLAKRLDQLNRPLEVMIEVKLSHEESKEGAAPESLPALDRCDSRTCPNLRLTGLMTMPPWCDDPEVTRPYFRTLAALAREHGLPKLSMGMSHDLEAAIEEGSTHVRVGTALFGPRKKE